MNFTFKEWQAIRHALEVAMKEYEQTRNVCTVSDNPNSMYQIFTRQIVEASEFIDRIDNAVL